MGADPNDPFVYDEPPYNVYLELRPLAPDGSFLPDSYEEKSDKEACYGEGAVGGEMARDNDGNSESDVEIIPPDASHVLENSADEDEDNALPSEYRPRRQIVEDRYVLYYMNGRYVRVVM